MSIKKYQPPIYLTNEIFHLYNRGVAKQAIFKDDGDFRHLLNTMAYYVDLNPNEKLSLVDSKNLTMILNQKPQKPIVEIIGYCLMPNHFHIVLRQLVDDGILLFVRRTLNSYSHYHNIKHDRVGPLFQGRTKGVKVKNDEQLLQLIRYIHLNPYSARLTQKPISYPWSSFADTVNNKQSRICFPKTIFAIAHSPENYKKFVLDYSDYARELEQLSKLVLE